MLQRIDTQQFDLLAFFEGQTLAHGVFEDRSGRPRRRFDVDMTGISDGDRLTLHEMFRFDDGEDQLRTWILRRNGLNRFTGTAEDCVGTAQGGFGDGMAWLRSTLRLQVGKRSIAMDFDDAFYPAGTGLVMNRSVVTKWGVRVGAVFITFWKP